MNKTVEIEWHEFMTFLRQNNAEHQYNGSAKHNRHCVKIRFYKIVLENGIAVEYRAVREFKRRNRKEMIPTDTSRFFPKRDCGCVMPTINVDIPFLK